MVTVVSNYCQLSQTQLSQTFAEKFTVTEELLQSLKKTALSGDEESIELLHNIALGYDEFGKKAEDILYHIVRKDVYKRQAHFLPFVAIAGKTVQKHQPG